VDLTLALAFVFVGCLVGVVGGMVGIGGGSWSSPS